jgi:hypothetical protein
MTRLTPLDNTRFLSTFEQVEDDVSHFEDSVQSPFEASYSELSPIEAGYALGLDDGIDPLHNPRSPSRANLNRATPASYFHAEARP